MVPLDDEAKEISDSFVKSGAWKHPIESLDMNYSQSVLSDLERLIAQKMVNEVKTVPNMSLGGVSAEDFHKLQEQVTQLMEQNAKLQAQALEQTRRRI